MSTYKQGSSHKLLIPISGAGNLRAGHLSSAAMHFGPLTHKFQQDGWEVENPIVLPAMGLRPMKSVYPEIEDIIDHKARKHPDSTMYLIGHSLGGFVASRYVSDHATDERLIGGVAVDTPHIPRLTGHMRNPASFTLSRVVDPDSAFYKETCRRAEMASYSPHAAKLILIGTTDSDLIATEAALASIPGAERYLVGNANELPAGARHLSTERRNHMDVLTCTRVIDFMIARGDELIAAQANYSRRQIQLAHVS